ncbi:DWNN domain [Macleaya cordata]|uniref:DWNN domain n=1 Tax=Macleaya cordata TaxID=56857 RepID=A0A200QVK5_MACCD|nr:DWNN domain [Macleaya cordata]
MAVYYKFKSAKDYVSIPIVGHFISVLNLKEQIFESKQLGKGTDFDLILTNAQTNEEYQDEAMMIPKNTSVLVRRVPGRPRLPIVIERKEEKVEDAQPAKSNSPAVDSSFMRYSEEIECNELANDLYDIPKVLRVQSSVPFQDGPFLNKADEDSKIKAHLLNKADEDSKIKALNDTPALDWHGQSQEGFGTGRSFGRVMGGRPVGGRGFGRGGLEWKTPPEGYICHRCKVPGHLIQHCPTNGDPSYDVKRMKPPTGIPKSMLMPTPDGSYGLPSGTVAILMPNEAAFEKEIVGLPCRRPVIDIPPELCCPLCKEVMRDAVLTSKCCFQSFCDKCIRGNIISKSMCICGATNMLADDLVPNKTVRDTINSILETNNSSSENTRSMLKSHDTESARSSLPKVPSPTLSATSTREKMPSPRMDGAPAAKEMVNEGKPVDALQSFEKGSTEKTANISEAKIESMNLKKQGNAPSVQEEVQQKLSACEPGKKTKKKKIRLPVNAGDQLWGTSQDIAAENYMMPFGSSAYNPYWGGMQPRMDGYNMAPYNGYMGYPIGGMLPQGPFGGQGYLLPGVPSQRVFSEFGMGLNPVPPHVMSREEPKARQADLSRKREIERRETREYFKGQDFYREVSSSGDVSSMKSKLVQRPTVHPSVSVDYQQHHHNHRSERTSSGAQRRSRVVSNHDESSDDDERNFKRQRNWYESSSSSLVGELEKKEGLLQSNRRSSSRDDHKDLTGRHYEERDYERPKWEREQIVLG